MQINTEQDNIRKILEESKEPLIISNQLQWEIFDWSLEKWNECLGDTKLQFRIGSKAYSKGPQWESRCDTLDGTFSDLLKFDEPDKWLYFDYKYLHQWFVDKFDLRNQINWKSCGYSEVTAEESSIWIGSQGAHTPCHIDTYGANLIAQITGKKLWLLFPPETDLKATRLPYEESTIYSKLNFYSPSIETISYLDKTAVKCKKIVLCPRQVLYVPNGWWHYVENLETSISINTWLPCASDNNARIDEALTLLMTKLFTNSLKPEEQQQLVNNPQSLHELSIGDIYNLLETSLKENNTNNANKSPETSKTESNTKKMRYNIETVYNLSHNELISFLKNQSLKFDNVDHCDSLQSVEDCTLKSTHKYLSILTSPDVVAMLKKKVLEASMDGS